MKIISAFVVWLLFSSLAFIGLPVAQQTIKNFLIVCAAILGGPITGLVHAVADQRLNSILPMFTTVIVVSALSLWFYFKRRALWILILTEVIWATAGLLLSVGVNA
jgi:predicted neutral ceramidase superfamily lipid hydrolase